MIHLLARKLLSSLPDGLLEPATERRLRAHLGRCARCRAELAALETSAALLRRLPRSLLPLRSHAAADERLDALARWERVPPLPLRPAAAGGGAWAPVARLASLAAVVALALVLGGGRPEAPDEVGSNEAFNFVLAGSFVARPPAAAPAVRARSFSDEGDQVARTWIHPPDSVYLPPGAR